MKKVKNLTENKGLINTFKKFKNKNHLFKSTLKKKYFFFSRLRQQIGLNRKLFYFVGALNKPFSKTIFYNNIKQVTNHYFLYYKPKSNFLYKPFVKLPQFKKTLMFINLYFY